MEISRNVYAKIIYVNERNYDTSFRQKYRIKASSSINTQSQERFDWAVLTNTIRTEYKGRKDNTIWKIRDTGYENWRQKTNLLEYLVRSRVQLD